MKKRETEAVEERELRERVRSAAAGWQLLRRLTPADRAARSRR